MDGNINLLSYQGFLDFLNEQAFPSDFRKWHVLNLVATSSDNLDIDFHVIVQALDLGFDPVGLPQSELTASTSYNDYSGLHSVV